MFVLIAQDFYREQNAGATGSTNDSKELTVDLSLKVKE